MKEFQLKKNDGSIDITILVDAINPTDDSATIYQIKGLTDANIAAGIDLTISPVSLTRLKALAKPYNASIYEMETDGVLFQLRQELYFTTTTIPGGVIDTPYTGAEIEAVGGVGDLTWEEHEDSDLPAGMSFDTASQELTGTPTEAGTFTLAVTVTDSEGTSVTKFFEYVIAAE